MNYMEEEIAPHERAPLEELKKRFQNVPMTPRLKNDETLFIRFLRARECDVDRAEQMLRNHLHWREINDVENIFTFKPPEVWKYYPNTVLGCDKTGETLRYVSLQKIDPKGMMKSAKMAELLKCTVWTLEGDALQLAEKSRKLGRLLYRLIYIYDAEDFPLSKALHKQTIQVVIKFLMMYEANYPERMKAFFIINAPEYFYLLYNAIRPLLTGSTVDKLKVFGKEGWKEAILSLIDADVLPASLGGTRTDPDGNPRCFTFLNYGGDVPESFFMSNSARRLSLRSDVKHLQVGRRSLETVALGVDRPGALLQWEFEAKGGDIGFGLSYRGAHGDRELVPVKRLEAHLGTEEGAHLCEAPGTYVLVFDNVYSWVKHKEIFYRATVMRPEENDTNGLC